MNQNEFLKSKSVKIFDGMEISKANKLIPHQVYISG